MGEMRKAIGREEQERQKKDRFASTLVIAASIRHGNMGDGRKRMGETTWLRLTEQWTATAKSVFLFDVQGSVAKSTFAGLPWLLYLLGKCVVARTGECKGAVWIELAFAGAFSFCRLEFSGSITDRPCIAE